MNNLRVLLVDDDEKFADVCRTLFVNWGWQPPLVSQTAKDVAGLLPQSDIVLLDLGLRDSHGLSTLQTVLNHGHWPVVVLSGLDDEDVAQQAIHAGAQDYLFKPLFDVGALKRAIMYALIRHQRKLPDSSLRQSLIVFRKIVEELNVLIAVVERAVGEGSLGSGRP